jgi:hypothetical protein
VAGSKAALGRERKTTPEVGRDMEVAAATWRSEGRRAGARILSVRVGTSVRARRDKGQNGKLTLFRTVKKSERGIPNVLHFRTEGVHGIMHFCRWN